MASIKPRIPAAGKRDNKSSVAITFAALGWLLFLFLCWKCTSTLSYRRAEIASIGVTHVELHKALQSRIDKQNSQVNRIKLKTGTGINDNNTEQAKLIGINNALKPQLETAKAEVAELETEVATREEEINGARDSLAVSNEDIKGLETKLTELLQEKEKLIDDYKRRYVEMKAVYEEKSREEDAMQLGHFWSSHRHTPFAPAAAFFAGEKLYQTEDFPFAAKYYGEILRRYPKSGYASYAIERIEQLNKQQLYQPQEIGFHPWRILSIIENP
jgi:TolA-binding protein